MSKETVEISIIIPTLNEEKYIKKCLTAINNQDFPREKYELIVSDGASTDKTVEIARKYADKVVITKKRAIWWEKNYGAGFAKGKYLIFIDADTIITKDYLKTVHGYLNEGYLGITTAHGIISQNKVTRFMNFIGNYYWKLRCILKRNCLLGLNICTTREAFIKIGGFKNVLLEDAQIYYDLRKIGRIIFVNKIKAYTSDRRYAKMGNFKLIIYYTELWLKDLGKAGKMSKAMNYKPIR